MRPVAAADRAPAAVVLLALALLAVAEGVPRRRLLVHLDPPARGLVGVEVAVPHLRAPGEDLLGGVVERGVLLHAEVPAGQVQGDVARVADGGDVSGPVPGGLHPVELGQDRHLPARREAAGLGDVDPDVVDEPLGDERRPLVGAVEELPHGDRRRALLADEAEPPEVLGGDGVLEEEEPEPLHVLAEAHGLGGGDPLVDVVEQLDLVAQLRPRPLEQLQGPAHVGGGLEDRLVVERLHPGRASPRAVPGHPGDAHLDADVAEALLDDGPGAVEGVLDLRPAGVGVAVGGLAHLAAEELVDGHPRLAALDVPQRHVHAAHGVVEDGAVAPVGAVVHGLPEVVDPVRLPADQEGLEVAVDGGDHQVGALGVGGAAVAVEPVLVRRDLHDHQAEPPGRGGDGPDVGDLRRREPPLRLLDLGLRGRGSAGSGGWRGLRRPRGRWRLFASWESPFRRRPAGAGRDVTSRAGPRRRRSMECGVVDDLDGAEP